MEKPFDIRRAALAGLAGAAAYLAEQYLDMRLLRFEGDDVRLLGQALTRRDPAWRAVGFALHATNGVALAIVYAALLRNRLPGAPVLRGLLLGEVENAVLWPLVPLVIDRYHPAIRDGLTPRLNTPAYAAQAILRHLAYGAVLGGVYG
jgi:hypothetical protein